MKGQYCQSARSAIRPFLSPMSSFTYWIWFRPSDAICFFMCSLRRTGFEFSLSYRIFDAYRTNYFAITIISFNIFTCNRALTDDIIPTRISLPSLSVRRYTFVQSTNICRDKRYRTCSRTYMRAWYRMKEGTAKKMERQKDKRGEKTKTERNGILAGPKIEPTDFSRDILAAIRWIYVYTYFRFNDYERMMSERRR